MLLTNESKQRFAWHDSVDGKKYFVNYFAFPTLLLLKETAAVCTVLNINSDNVYKIAFAVVAHHLSFNTKE